MSEREERDEARSGDVDTSNTMESLRRRIAHYLGPECDGASAPLLSASRLVAAPASEDRIEAARLTREYLDWRAARRLPPRAGPGQRVDFGFATSIEAWAVAEPSGEGLRSPGRAFGL